MQTKLTPEQAAEVRLEEVPNGLPVRFQRNGQTLNILTGELQERGINVIYQRVYWGFTKETSLKIAAWLGVKAVFDKSGDDEVAA